LDYDENYFGNGGIRLQLTGDVAFIAVIGVAVIVVGVAVIVDLGDDDYYGVLRIVISEEFEDWGRK
jgi:hypothetical protein